MKLIITILLVVFTFNCFSQINRPSKSRLKYSQPTKLALRKLDSLLYRDTLLPWKLGKVGPTLEFKTIGDGFQSKRFGLYKELTKVATEKEFLSLVADTAEMPAIRGYAFMGYLNVCDSKKVKPQSLNYNFMLDVKNGNKLGPCSFSEFKKEVEKGRMFETGIKH